MKKEKKAAAGLREEERRRFEYMIAWRERYIEKQRELLEGREEERELMLSLLSVMLDALAGHGEGVSVEKRKAEVEVRIGKQAVREALGRWRARCTESEEAFELLLVPAADSAEEGNGDQT